MELRVDEKGNPKPEVYGPAIARYCTKKEIQWMMEAPQGEYLKRHKKLLLLADVRAGKRAQGDFNRWKHSNTFRQKPVSYPPNV